MEKIEVPITRAAFLRSLGLSSAALMSIYCLGGLTACTSKKNEPEPQIDFTLDLSDPANSNLTKDGGFLYQGNVIVARISSTDFVALSKVCTHEGTTILFEANNNRFHCPNHDSNYRTDGSIINGPAAVALKKYHIELAGNLLHVSEEPA
jgi:cytochrome b6-f complex iron-sulfur subunit